MMIENKFLSYMSVILFSKNYDSAMKLLELAHGDVFTVEIIERYFFLNSDSEYNLET